MTRSEGLGRLAVLARTHNVELALQPLTQAEMAALFGAVATSPLAMPWHRLELPPDTPCSEVLPNSLDQVDDDDLRQLRDRGAVATSNAGDYRDDEPTLVDVYRTCDTDPSELTPAPEDE